MSLSLLLASYSWAAYIDPVMSVLLSGFILIFAYSILSSSMTDLLDKALDESMQLLIVRALAEFFDEYTQILGVRSRRSGGEIFIELELEFERGPQHGRRPVGRRPDAEQPRGEDTEQPHHHRAPVGCA